MGVSGGREGLGIHFSLSYLLFSFWQGNYWLEGDKARRCLFIRIFLLVAGAGGGLGICDIWIRELG